MFHAVNIMKKKSSDNRNTLARTNVSCIKIKTEFLDYNVITNGYSMFSPPNKAT